MSKISAKVIGCKERRKLSVSIFHRAGLSRKAPVLFIQFRSFFFYKNLGPAFHTIQEEFFFLQKLGSSITEVLCVCHLF